MNLWLHLAWARPPLGLALTMLVAAPQPEGPEQQQREQHAGGLEGDPGGHLDARPAGGLEGDSADAQGLQGS